MIASCEFSGWLVRIDLPTMRVTGELKVGGMPVDVRSSPDGTVMYVANQGRGGVSVIDPVTMTETGFITTGARRPRSVPEPRRHEVVRDQPSGGFDLRDRLRDPYRRRDLAHRRDSRHGWRLRRRNPLLGHRPLQRRRLRRRHRHRHAGHSASRSARARTAWPFSRSPADSVWAIPATTGSAAPFVSPNASGRTGEAEASARSSRPVR